MALNREYLDGASGGGGLAQEAGTRLRSPSDDLAVGKVSRRELEYM